MSWVPVDSSGPLAMIVRGLTKSVLVPIHNVLNPINDRSARAWSSNRVGAIRHLCVIPIGCGAHYLEYVEIQSGEIVPNRDTPCKRLPIDARSVIGCGMPRWRSLPLRPTEKADDRPGVPPVHALSGPDRSRYSLQRYAARYLECVADQLSKLKSEVRT